MRTKVILLAILICSCFASAQDVITKTDGSAIKAKVEELTETVVKYRRYDNPSGPIYSIPISSVAKIVYENGAVDNLATEEASSAMTNNSTAQSGSNLNEAELYRYMARLENNTKIDYKKRAKTYRKVGWIGGATMAVIGIGVGIGLSTVIDELGEYYYSDAIMIYGGIGVGVGAIWCLGWNLAANNQMKKAREEAIGYSVPVIKQELFNANGTSLAASVNMMGNNTYANHNLGLGLGLTLNF